MEPEDKQSCAAGMPGGERDLHAPSELLSEADLEVLAQEALQAVEQVDVDLMHATRLTARVPPLKVQLPVDPELRFVAKLQADISIRERSKVLAEVVKHPGSVEAIDKRNSRSLKILVVRALLLGKRRGGTQPGAAARRSPLHRLLSDSRALGRAAPSAVSLGLVFVGFVLIVALMRVSLIVDGDNPLSVASHFQAGESVPAATNASRTAGELPDVGPATVLDRSVAATAAASAMGLPQSLAASAAEPSGVSTARSGLHHGGAAVTSRGRPSKVSERTEASVGNRWQRSGLGVQSSGFALSSRGLDGGEPPDIAVRASASAGTGLTVPPTREPAAAWAQDAGDLSGAVGSFSARGASFLPWVGIETARITTGVGLALAPTTDIRLLHREHLILVNPSAFIGQGKISSALFDSVPVQLKVVINGREIEGSTLGLRMLADYVEREVPGMERRTIVPPLHLFHAAGQFRMAMSVEPSNSTLESATLGSLYGSTGEPGTGVAVIAPKKLLVTHVAAAASSAGGDSNALSKSTLTRLLQSLGNPADSPAVASALGSSSPVRDE